MTAVPIRWRVTAAFCAAFAIVMSAVGALVLVGFTRALAVADDRALRVRVDALAAAQSSSAAVLPLGGNLGGFDESPTQILDGQGRPVASSTGLRVALLTVDQTRQAWSRPLLTDRPGAAGLDETLRLLAQPVVLPDGRKLVVVAASSVDETRERVHSLALIGSFGLLVAVVLCGVTGYVVSGVALKPVEAMRRDAEAVNAAGHGRLRTPLARDEISRLADTLNAMLHRIQSARDLEQSSLQRERRFVTDASHELRGPLTTLRSEVELALAEASPNVAQLRAALASAGDDTSRLCALTDDLLMLSRTQALGSQRRDVDLGALLAAVVDEHRDAVRDAGRDIRLSVLHPLRARVDAVLIRSAVNNLVGNALVHGSGSVECTAWRQAGAVHIRVVDRGRGFGAEFVRRAREPFSRADTARHGPGSGLGLAIVEAVAKAHDGELLIEDHAAGAVVLLRLPDPSDHDPTVR